MAAIQHVADELIQAYIVCCDTVNRLEREHGYITDMRRKGTDYVWYFVDRSSVILNEKGEIPTNYS